MGIQSWPNGIVMATDMTLFHMDKHISYWLRCLRSPLPTQYTSNDSNRMTLAFFVVSALDLLGILFTHTDLAERQEYIDWIYHCQHPDGGFRGFPATEFGERRSADNAAWDPANLAATYFALSTLCVLRDDLSRVKRKECLRWLRSVQRPDGSFGELLGPTGQVEGGNDTRYGYCAMGTRWILRGSVFGEIEGEADVDVDKLVACIRKAEVGRSGLLPVHSDIVEVYADRYYRRMMVVSQKLPIMKHMVRCHRNDIFTSETLTQDSRFHLLRRSRIILHRTTAHQNSREPTSTQRRREERPIIGRCDNSMAPLTVNVVCRRTRR